MYITKITACILFYLVILHSSPHDFTDFQFLNLHDFFETIRTDLVRLLMCRHFFLRNNRIGPNVCENLEFLKQCGEQEIFNPNFLTPHREYNSSRESIQL